MPAFSLAEFLANKFVRAFIVTLVAFLLGAGIATWKVSTHYISKIAIQQAIYDEQVSSADLIAKAVNVVVVTQYKTKVVTIDQKKKDIDQQIEDKVTNEDDHRCTLGPEFVRLHNLSARPVPDAGRSPDEAATKRTSRTGP